MFEWCGFYNVWLDDVEEIIESGAGQCCDFDCSECEYKEKVRSIK